MKRPLVDRMSHSYLIDMTHSNDSFLRFGIILKVTLLLKTSSQNILELESLIVENHPYDVPCIMFLPLSSVHFPFLSWALEQTTTASP